MNTMESPDFSSSYISDKLHRKSLKDDLAQRHLKLFCALHTLFIPRNTID